MQIAKSRILEYVGLMEENIIEIDKELSDLRLGDSIMREKLQDTRLRDKLQVKETQLATMASLSMEDL